MAVHPKVEKLRILVLGYIVRGPLGGLAWHHLQYVLGLYRMGHEVFFIEDSGDYPSCYDPTRGVTDADPSYGLRFAGQAFDRLGLGSRWAYYDAFTGRWQGPCAGRILELCANADMFINVSGVNEVRPWIEGVPHRVLIDTDPAFTQIRVVSEPSFHELALKHNAFFSFAENIGGSDCSIPCDGLPWKATRQPVVLDAWPVTPGPSNGRFTTVMQWESYPAREHKGVMYWMKSHSFTPYMNLPEKTAAPMEIALGSPNAPRDLLRSKGWLLQDPLAVTLDPWTYQDYIRSSKAEFGVAKHGYVLTKSGWFSERSAAYMASGRPVVIQDTGFSKLLPVGMGVLTFTCVDEAVSAIENLCSRYHLHCAAAREIAADYFDAHLVLTQLIETTVNARTSPYNG
jgi:hypothetical protein